VKFESSNCRIKCPSGDQAWRCMTLKLRMTPDLSFRKRSYTEWLERLEAARAWLEINCGRVARYSQLIRDFYEKGARSPKHFLAICESWEIVCLFDLWKDRAAAFPGLAEKLRAAFAKGPALSKEEKPTTSSNRPRNDGFGYLVAGTLLSIGVPVVAVDGKVARTETCKSEADATFRWEDLLINVECKRPQSQEALGKLTKEARKQIEHPSRGGCHGVIALDCSVVIRPKWNLLGCDSEEAAKRSERSISIELEKSILPQIKIHLNDSILGFILFARVPAKTRVRSFGNNNRAGRAISRISFGLHLDMARRRQ
jgi:hypothetical protein